MWEGVALAAIAALAWWWHDSMRARERALAVAGAACRRDRLQLLDETVECVKIWPARGEGGHMALRRTYRFEFSDTGDNRRAGSVVILGTTVESLYLEPFLVQ
ncbi:MAG: hypothetical protein A3G25_14715 [Betaproteobacteria bacterium RIFCSPLOWO2_12_FULL_63_13]|nr:MAG: hypothetical protein A3H32_17810 [Betaproteobacteria bacterium RIFCSPLOWO2_02_FULL_63_19]OGA46140.1 MAG: hypothetical protein A3G25_14715 [Betaproteobacteria bacterium RIFCSPLOWO2_12_FULL_63_13]